MPTKRSSTTRKRKPNTSVSLARTARQAAEVAPAAGGQPVPAAVRVPPPVIRPLKAYAFDPSIGRFIGNEMTIEVKYEPLLPGPMGKKVAVIDYDGANQVFYTPVDLDDPSLLIRGGLAPSESDPRFHQQMVYAVVSDTIQHFEAALGRRTRWRRGLRKLYLYPHAMISANAAYSRAARGILFGYFRASQEDPGRNLPGQTVFTCLSHDIIVHETTHAILDGIRVHFAERSNPEVPAFHEAFADLAALFRHFTHRTALLDTIQKTGGLLYQYHLQPDVGANNPSSEGIQAELRRKNPLIGLAQQFGEARGTGKALRSALSEPPSSTRINDTSLEPHQRGAILVSAVFDAYFTVYLRRTEDLFRIFRASGGSSATVELSASMANLLAEAASRTANDFFRICVRAIDYCPPVDITFGDYLRAVITADRDLRPEDKDGVRDAFMEAFRLRGIIPHDAEFYSEDALCWPEVAEGRLPPIKGLIFGDPNGLTAAESRANAITLYKYAKQCADELGFDPDPGLKISVDSFHPAFRVGPDGRLRVDMVVEITQCRNAPFDPKRPELGTFPVRVGCTMLIPKPALSDDTYGDARVRYLIQKRIDQGPGPDRVDQQRQFNLSEGLLEGSGDERFNIDFNLLHGGI